MADESGFGVSVTTFHNGNDIDDTGATISGVRVALGSGAHRLMTLRGFFRRWPDYGYDLRSRVGARVSSVGLARLRAEVEQEALKDSYVRNVESVEILRDSDSRWRVRIALELEDGQLIEGVLLVTTVSVSILEEINGRP